MIEYSSLYNARIKKKNCIVFLYMPRECYICLRSCRRHTCEMYLVDNKQYFFDCKCTVHAHKRCLTKWIGQNPTCIICRRKMAIFKTHFEILRERVSQFGLIRTLYIAGILYCLYKIMIYNFARVLRE